MNKELMDAFKDTPRIVDPTFEMSSPNELLNIYKGEMTLKYDDKEFNIIGEINLKWFPSVGPVLSGQLEKNYEIFRCDNCDVYIDGLKFGLCYLTSQTISTDSNYLKLEGSLTDIIIAGDKSIEVDFIDFSVPNMRDIHGSTVVKITESNICSSASRTVFKAGDFTIIMDNVSNPSNLMKLLDNMGGYINLYGGRLSRCDQKPISYNDSRKILEAFGVFLSFVNGRKTAAIIRKGIYDGNEIWVDYTKYNLEIYKPVRRWSYEFASVDLASMWESFYLLWKNQDDREAIEITIHWYIQANGNAGALEGSTIMAQSALELLYNWILIEGKKIMVGKDAENISATNKIRLLLSSMNIDFLVPDNFIELKDFVANSNDLNDAPDAIVLIRNAIIHAQLEKRRRLSDIHYRIKHQALELSLWYIEMSILYSLKYKGVYVDRRAPVIGGAKATYVPWNNNLN